MGPSLQHNAARPPTPALLNADLLDPRGAAVDAEGRPAVAEQQARTAASNGALAPRAAGLKRDPPPGALALLPRSEADRDPTLERLLALVRTHSEPSDADIAAIVRAYQFADAAHAHQKRESGEPYIKLPLAVAL